ncbi:serpin family protein [Butyrivibrio fibrisolvens]|uniref:serpin family protein n=1 Tax=Butyrivibrio fibrisolvens TaxID=831 RepID=UPI0020BFBE19|nr:serpin family protein [Butyrivibrio fibrisolvens]
MKKRIISSFLTILAISNLITGCSSPVVSMEDNKTQSTSNTTDITDANDQSKSSTTFNDTDLSNVPDITSDYDPSNVSADTTLAGSENFNTALIQYISENRLKDENFMISPTSFRAAMALAIAGADNDTKDELLHAMGFNDMEELVAWYTGVTGSIDNFNKLLEEDKAYYNDNREDFDDNSSEPDGAFELENSIWRNTTSASGELSQDYMNYVAKNFDATACNVSADEITDTVNNWIKDSTDGLIDSISDDLSLVDLVLINTLYLKTAWAESFNEGGSDDFTTIQGDIVKKDYIYQEDTYKYYEDSDCTFVVIPLNGGIDAVFILGDATDVMTKIPEASYEDVNVCIPKFETETTFSNDDLITFCQERGAYSAFGSDADFSLMSSEMNLYISDIIQKTKIEVDENGIKAAAATAVMMSETCAEPGEVINFIANQPFTYMILTDSETPELLFYGQLVK